MEIVPGRPPQRPMKYDISLTATFHRRMYATLKEEAAHQGVSIRALIRMLVGQGLHEAQWGPNGWKARQAQERRAAAEAEAVRDGTVVYMHRERETG